jgi:multiple sugar transport system ATP-binding protein
VASVDFVNINKVYENGVHAIHDLNLSIVDGEFIVIVGPDRQ